MKHKILVAILVIICSTLLFGCEYLIDDYFPFDQGEPDDEDNNDDLDGSEEHECVFGDWYIVFDPTCEEEGEKERACKICSEIETELIEKSDHTVVTDPAESATETSPGKTEGKHCSVCGEIIIRQEYIYSNDYSTPDKYSGTYAYDYLLENYEKGEKMQSLYRSIDENVEYFHSSSVDAKSKLVSGKELYYAAEIDITEFDLTDEEAVAVWSAYRLDHPLYYWLSNKISYSSKMITLVVYDEYATNEVRAEYNSQIYSRVKDYIVNLDGKGSEYQIALSFHDGIILSADYAYEDDGVTPENDAYAHNVLGVMVLGEGVCESYTKAFQLLLNYCGVENVYVSGYSNGPHAWNLVKLDNGEWYWFDLTWDDTPTQGIGVKHSYFAVNDTDNVKIFDGSAEASGTFVDDHTPDSPTDYGAEFAYSIPDRGESSFDYNGVMLRDDIIVIDGLSYVVCGSDICALIDIAKEGDVVIPEVISYQDVDYKVVVIAKFENGMLSSGSVIEVEALTLKTPSINSITIPRTVEMIWDYAFVNCKSLKYFAVDSKNDVYTAKDGILFTKSLYTMIQYPLGAEVASYSVPGETVEIAYGAFGDGGNYFCPASLKNLYIGKNVSVIGGGNFGHGYRDRAPEDPSDVIVVNGYLEKLQKVFRSGLHIEK